MALRSSGTDAQFLRNMQPVKDRDDFLLQMRHYLQKNSGFIKYEKESDLKVIEKSLEQLSNKYLLEYVLIYSPVQIKCEKEN